MHKLIVTSRFMKPVHRTHTENYVRYIATRTGVELLPERKNDSATPKQNERIKELVSEFPESKHLPEYEIYEQNPTSKNASICLSAVIDFNMESLCDREIYMNYLGTRPGVVTVGAHGLFTSGDNTVALDRAAREVAEHDGIVWTHVVSLRRVDAERMGYTTLSAWRNLVGRHIPDIAKAQKIELNHIRWYAAFHNKENNPHVHIVVYSTDKNEGYLSKRGIDEIRSAFANDIYHDALYHLYEKQTEVRNKIRSDSAELMKSLLDKMQNGTYSNLELEMLVQKLSEQLKSHKGKKQYGYLQPNVKKTVDEIVVQLARNECITKMYREWCELEQEKYSTYTNELKTFPPLYENKVFKPIKNRVIDIVSNMIFAPVSYECTEQEHQNISESNNDTAERIDRFNHAELNKVAVSMLLSFGRLISDDYTLKIGSKLRCEHKLKTAISRKKKALGLKEDRSIKQY